SRSIELLAFGYAIGIATAAVLLWDQMGAVSRAVGLAAFAFLALTGATWIFKEVTKHCPILVLCFLSSILCPLSATAQPCTQLHRLPMLPIRSRTVIRTGARLSGLLIANWGTSASVDSTVAPAWRAGRRALPLGLLFIPSNGRRM